MKEILFFCVMVILAVLSCKESPTEPTPLPTVSISIDGAAIANAIYRITVCGSDMKMIGPNEYTGDQIFQSAQINVPEGADRKFRLECYNSSGNLVDTATVVMTISSGIINKAIFKLTPLRMIKYSVSGQFTGTVPKDTGHYAKGSFVTVDANTGNLDKTDSSFSSWNTKSDGSGTPYFPSSKIHIDTSDITLYAIFTSKKLTVTFNTNGGPTVAPVSVTTNSKITEPSIEQNGKKLVGWFKNDNFTEQWDFSTDIVTQSMTLYAKWNSPVISAWLTDFNSTFLKNDGSVWTIGMNINSQMGITVYSTDKIECIASNVVQITGNSAQSFYVDKNFNLYGCGNNWAGSLGNGTTAPVTKYTLLMTNVIKVAHGNSHTLVLKNDGSVWAAGLNQYGELGKGTWDDTSLTFIHVFDDAKDVECGNQTSYVIKNDNSLWVCGANDIGQIGKGDTSQVTTFTKLMDNVRSVAIGYEFALIIKIDNSLYGVGNNQFSQLANSKNEYERTPVFLMNDIQSVSAGYGVSVMIKTDGSLWGCGYNKNGQLGVNSTDTFVSTPTLIMNDVKIACSGYDAMIFVKNDYSLWAAGNNAFGKLTQKALNGNNISPVDISF